MALSAGKHRTLFQFGPPRACHLTGKGLSGQATVVWSNFPRQRLSAPSLELGGETWRTQGACVRSTGASGRLHLSRFAQLHCYTSKEGYERQTGVGQERLHVGAGFLLPDEVKEARRPPPTILFQTSVQAACVADRVILSLPRAKFRVFLR